MRSKGFEYEQKAVRYLKKQGLKLLKQNHTCRHGEIDLIMQDGDVLVFVEVRYRESSGYGSALESITHSKQRKLLKAAHHFMMTTHYSNMFCRFDTITYDGDSPKSTIFRTRNSTPPTWIKSAFEENLSL